MAWPENEKVLCIGFSEKILPALKRAIEDKKVEWIPGSTVYANTAYEEFIWFDCLWSIREHYEVVQVICLKSGKLNDENLTVEVLRG